MRIGFGITRRIGPFWAGASVSRRLGNRRSRRQSIPDEPKFKYMHEQHLYWLEELHKHHALTDDEYNTIKARITRMVAVWQAKQRLEK
jgi:hypothetical protein